MCSSHENGNFWSVSAALQPARDLIIFYLASMDAAVVGRIEARKAREKEELLAMEAAFKERSRGGARVFSPARLCSSTICAMPLHAPPPRAYLDL